MTPIDEIELFLEYNPRNDTYRIHRFDRNEFFETDGQDDIFRRWGRSNIFVSYKGDKIIRFEMHPIPCLLPVSGMDTCVRLGAISVPRLVAECWNDKFTPDAIVARKNSGTLYPNAASNLVITGYGGSYRHRDPLDYDLIGR